MCITETYMINGANKLSEKASSVNGRVILPYYIHTLKFIYSEKATKFCKIFTLLLQCWTEGRSSTAVAEDFRPTATVTVDEV